MAAHLPISELAPAQALARVHVQQYARAVKIACDDLHADPFNRQARAELIRLIVDDTPESDIELLRALANRGGRR
jgi:hypothetical protein